MRDEHDIIRVKEIFVELSELFTDKKIKQHYEQLAAVLVWVLAGKGESDS